MSGEQLEAIEWRTANNSWKMSRQVAAMGVFTGVILAAISVVAEGIVVKFGLLLFAICFYAISLWLFIKVKGAYSRGYCRTIGARAGGYDDPPLDEWCEELEERSAFAEGSVGSVIPDMPEGGD